MLEEANLVLQTGLELVCREMILDEVVSQEQDTSNDKPWSTSLYRTLLGKH